MKQVVMFLAVAGLTLVAAQPPQRCVSPPTWHAHLFQVSPTSRYELRGRIYYDQVEERIAIKEEIELGEVRDFYEDFAFFKTHVRYRFNARTKQCFKYVLNDTFRPFEIPFEANFIDRVEIGSNGIAGAGVEVDIWEGRAVDGGTVVGVWTVEGCVPVSERYYSERNGYTITDFYDVELGYNPDDFVPPANCA